MLTRELALQRLRETGTLSSSARAKNAITRDQARNPVVQAIVRVTGADVRRDGARCLAPSANHGVLP